MSAIHLRSASDLAQYSVRAVADFLLIEDDDNRSEIQLGDSDDPNNKLFSTSWGRCIWEIEGRVTKKLFYYDKYSNRMSMKRSCFSLIHNVDRRPGCTYALDLLPFEEPASFHTTKDGWILTEDQDRPNEEILSIMLRILYPVTLWYFYLFSNNYSVHLQRLTELVVYLRDIEEKSDVRPSNVLKRAAEVESVPLSTQTLERIAADIDSTIDTSPVSDFFGSQKREREEAATQVSNKSRRVATTSAARTHSPVETKEGFDTDSTIHKISAALEKARFCLFWRENFGIVTQFALDQNFIYIALSTTKHSLLRLAANRAAHASAAQEPGVFGDALQAATKILANYGHLVTDPVDVPTLEETTNVITTLQQISDTGKTNAKQMASDWVSLNLSAHALPDYFVTTYYPEL